MAEAKDLKTAIERSIKALKARPTIGRGTAATTVKVRSGVTCEIEDGPWKLIADEMPGDGGAGLGPDPGVLGRAALGSCLAMGYVMWASQMDIVLDSVEVTVEADYDANGMFGTIDLAGRKTSPCHVLVKVQNGKFVRVEPTKVGKMDCAAKNVKLVKLDLFTG